jgi:hypothetical protein
VRIIGLGKERQTHNIDVRVTRVGSASYVTAGRVKPVDELLIRHAREKRAKYEATIKARGQVFDPFVVSTCGILGPSAQALLDILASQYAERKEMSYSVAKAMMKAHIGVAIIKGGSWGVYEDRSAVGREAETPSQLFT